MTGPEWALWSALRQREQMGVKFRRQHPFGPYILDFFCQEKLLAVELDGRSHANTPAREHDAARDAYLRSFGVEVLRVTNDAVIENAGGVAGFIKRALDARPNVGSIRGLPPEETHPLPPPSGRGETFPLLSALVPNARGVESALALFHALARPNKLSVFTAASETFAHKNTNASIAETLERFRPVLEQAHAANLPVRGYISCVIACPFEGPIAPAAVARVAEQLADLGVDEIDLGDTIGAGTPETTAAMLNAVAAAVGEDWLDFEHESLQYLTLHLHDTFGRAADCVKAALDLGVRSFDGSVAGLGGCPYASTPGNRAPGNIATEILVRTIHDSGHTTGVDLDRLAEAAAYARDIVARARSTPPSP